MKKEIFLFSALAAVLVTGCAVSGNTASNTDNQVVISTTIDEAKDEQNADGVQADDAKDNTDASEADNAENANAEADNSADGTGSDVEVTGSIEADSSSVAFTEFGHYADMQGTEDVYSDILIKENADGSIFVEMGIFRLTTLTGTGTPTADANKLEYTDNELEIKGTIEVTESGAVFTVTESEWELITAGEVFEFPTELND